MAKFSTAELVSKMKATTCLNHWDVLVAYDQDGLDALLKEQHEKLAPTVTNLSFSQLCEDPGDNSQQQTVDWKLQLRAPTLQLTDNDGLVELNFGLEGTYIYKPSGKQMRVPPGTGMRCRTVLTNVVGEVEWRTAASGPEKQSNINNVVFFDDKATQGGHTVIDLTQPESILQVGFVDADGQTVSLYDVATHEFIDHFQKEGLKYHIGTISNQSNDNSMTIKPRSFLMTTVPGNPKATPPESSCILFWINVVGGDDNGKRNDNKDDPLIFAVPEQSGQTSPLPIGKTATIMFSQHFMYQMFIKPALESKGYTGVSITSDYSGAGMYLRSTPQDQLITIPRFEDELDSDEKGYDEISFNMKDNTALISLVETGPTVLMSYSVSDCHFWTHNYVPAFGTTQSVREKQDGSFDVDFTITGAGTWASTVGKEDLSLAFTFPSTFSPNVKPQEQGFFDKLWGAKTDVGIAEIYELKANVPDVKFDMGSLDYFMTTNLLLPGEHVFVPDEISKGFFIPADFILTGELAKPEPKPT